MARDPDARVDGGYEEPVEKKNLTFWETLQIN
jgi:hypothetical protein